MKKFFLLTLLVSLFLAPTSSAETLGLKYEARWNGIKTAEMRVYLNETPTDYRYQALIDTVGIFRRISKYWGINKTIGRIKGGQYFPSSFDAKWQPKKKPAQRIVVTYAKDGTVNEKAIPPQDRPEVLQKDKKHIPDPITASTLARQKVSQIINSGLKLPQNFSIRTFDSRRVFDLNFAVTGYENRKIGGKAMKLLKITMTRTPIAGFSEKELKKENKEGPAFDLYVDDNYIPIVADGHSAIGQATISLVKTCAAADCSL